MLLFRAGLFYFGMVLTTLIFFPLSVLLLPVPLPLRFRIMSQWSVINLCWLKISCGLDFEVEGRENIPDGAGIIMCKHQSAWETIALQLVFPAQVWVIKKELLWIPIYGWGLAAMQPIAIDRKSAIKAMRQIVKQGTARLQQGLWVVIFPEGTRVATCKQGKYLPGGGMLAEKSGYPIIPVAHNAGYFWPKNSFRKRPGTIKMVIGPAIEAQAKSAGEITRQTEQWIETTMQKLPVPELKP